MIWNKGDRNLWIFQKQICNACCREFAYIVHRVDAWFRWNARWNRLCVFASAEKQQKKSSERMRLILVTGVLSILCTEFKPFHLVADSIERENCIRWKPLVLRELTKSKINEKRDFEISWKTNRFDVFEEKKMKKDRPSPVIQTIRIIDLLVISPFSDSSKRNHFTFIAGRYGIARDLRNVSLLKRSLREKGKERAHNWKTTVFQSDFSVS